MGKVLGVSILGKIGDISRFPELKKLATFVGIAPSIHQAIYAITILQHL
ncbi:transposase [Hydrogenoanaerobacterium sp.]